MVLAVSLGLPTLWVGWAAFRDAGRSAAAQSGPGLPQIADGLAAAARRQWDTEAAARRLNDPYPMPVSWTAAADLAVPWKSLGKLAASGAGWPTPAPGRVWAKGPAGLAGEGGELAAVLEKVPTGRLVVLGEPGSGKTMLMVRLVLDLLTARAAGGPVPVLAPLASWDPSAQTLNDWLATRLITDYPALAGPPPAGAIGPTRAAALLEAGLILPVLDGLDELPEKVRGRAISRINDALRPGGQVLLTCRTQPYRDAIRPRRGPRAALAGAAAIRLRPLDAGAVRRWLRDDASGPVTRARWDPVLTLLGTQAPAGQALTTPLMVALARAIYNPRPGEAATAVPDPAELCRLPSREAVEAHLFDGFIPAAYRPSAEGRWTAGQAGRWLAFLARHLEHTIGTPDLAWWQLDTAAPRTARMLGLGLVAGLMTGLITGIVGGLAIGLVVGIAIGIVVGIVAASGPQRPAHGLLISTARLRAGARTGLGTGLVVGIGAGIVAAIVAGPGVGLAIGIETGLAGGLATGIATGVAGAPSDIAEAIGPRIVLARDRQVMLFFTLGIGLIAGLAAALGLMLITGLAASFLARLEYWLGIGLGIGLIAGLERTKWASYTLARGWLALRGQLPWPLMAFLADAHQRGVLRQAGATYQFRHLELQRRLATGHSQPHPGLPVLPDSLLTLPGGRPV